jgi:hypothetical protein
MSPNIVSNSGRELTSSLVTEAGTGRMRMLATASVAIFKVGCKRWKRRRRKAAGKVHPNQWTNAEEGMRIRVEETNVAWSSLSSLQLMSLGDNFFHY